MLSSTLRSRADWLTRSVVCGYFATLAMLIVLGVAYTALLFGSQAAAGPAGWAHELADNSLAAAAKNSPYFALAIHFLTGIALAVAYGAWAEPRISGPAWRKGLLFATVPCLLSLIVFFPLTGAGLLGFALGAGPLPIAGNMILHSVYGLTLGLLYAPMMDIELSGPGRHNRQHVLQVVAGTFRGAAVGLTGGTLLGLLVSPLAIHILSTNGTLSGDWMRLSAILLGGTLGCLIGLCLGQTLSSRPADSYPLEAGAEISHPLL